MVEELDFFKNTLLNVSKNCTAFQRERRYPFPSLKSFQVIQKQKDTRHVEQNMYRLFQMEKEELECNADEENDVTFGRKQIRERGLGGS